MEEENDQSHHDSDEAMDGDRAWEPDLVEGSERTRKLSDAYMCQYWR